MSRDSTAGGKGVSLAKGPVGILGLIGIVYGLSALIFSSHGFALHIPHGTVHGTHWIGLEVNGWTELMFIAAGLLLLLSAPLHWGAKSMSLLLGLALIAAAIIAIIRGNGVFGIFAANHLTELVWAAAGVLLLVLGFLPRVGGGETGRDDDAGAVAAPGAATDQRSGEGSRRLVRRRGPDTDGHSTGRRSRRTAGVQEQDRPPSAGAQSTDDNPVS